MCFLRYDVIHCHDGIDHDILSDFLYVFLIIGCLIYDIRIEDELLEHEQRHVATIFFNSLAHMDTKCTHVIMAKEIVNLDCLSKVDSVREWVIL